MIWYMELCSRNMGQGQQCNSSCKKNQRSKASNSTIKPVGSKGPRESAATSINTQLMEGIGGTSGGSLRR